MNQTLFWIITAALLAAGCGDDTTGTDTGTPDTGTDTTVGDSAPADSGPADADAGDAAPPYVPDWSCLGSVTIEAPTAATATLTATLTEFTSEGPPEGVLVELCAFDDLDCTAPVDSGMTDVMGMVSLTAPTDPDPFFGYTVATFAGFPRHEYFLSNPLSNDLEGAAAIITESAANVVGLAIGETQDWGANGAVAAVAIDCANRISSGVTFELTSGVGTPWYSESGTFTTTRTETDVGGSWGLINPVPGDFTATASVGGTLMATINFRVKAGVVTGVIMNPTPDGLAYTP